MKECSTCSVTQSTEADNWPDGIISVKMTMNPYLLALAAEESMKRGMRTWELINLALWEKLGKPEKDELLDFAAGMEVLEEDPKWKKRLKLTARHEVEVRPPRETQTAPREPGNCDQCC